MLPASDATTGSAPVDKEILAAAIQRAAKSYSSAPATETTAHRNPVPSVLRGPEREENLNTALLQRAAETPAPIMGPVAQVVPKFGTSMNQLSDELGMKAGALTTVPEVADYEPSAAAKRLTASDASRSSVVSELAAEARDKGIKGRGVQAYIQERTGMPGASNYMKEPIVTEQDVADEKARERRTHREALNMGGGRKRTVELTTEEYKALSPEKKAAVDLNTLLVTAVREDLKAKTASPEGGGKEYDAAVAEMFGEKKSEDALFAPQTMQVLQNIGFKGELGTKLNDVLKLKIGLSSDDLDNLEPEMGPFAPVESPAMARDDLTDALVAGFRKTRKDPQRGAALLETQRNVLGTREAFNFGSDANNAMVEQVYEYLANPANKGKMQQTMALAKDTLSEEHWPMFLAFLDVRSREAIQFDNPLGMNPESDYMRPKRFRSRLGL